MSRTLASTVRTFAITGVATFAVLGVGHAAFGLWSDTSTVTVPAFQTGTVQFAAEPHPAGSDAKQFSTGTGERLANGTPVTVTLPGPEIAKVLDGPATWRFRVSGYAQGIAGMEYDISYSGAGKGTLLAGSTMRVFPAANGDCSAVPKNQPALTDQVLQEAGANTAGAQITEEWCVSIVWNYDPDGYHLNSVTATATGEDGSISSAYDEFGALISYPVSLDPFGIHTNTAFAEGTGEDGTLARAQDNFDAVLYPDPLLEPSVPISITPHVTNITD